MNDAAEQMHTRISVFLSYSRKDAQFVRKLAAALEAKGYSPIFDQSDHAHDDPDLRLTAQDEWWLALKTMISASDAMIFIVTPESAASNVCDDEIAHARSLGRRIIAILRRPIDFNTAPERIRALNVKIDFSDESDRRFAAELDALCAELDLDIDWHRRGSRWSRLADQWISEGRPDALLLRAGAIADAEAWALRRPKDAPEPGELLLAFLDASRAFETAQHDRQRRTIGRAFVSLADRSLSEGCYDAALRRAATGAILAEDPDLSLNPELWRTSARAIFQDRTRIIIGAHEGSYVSANFSADGSRIVTASNDGTARIWDSSTGTEIQRFNDKDYPFIRSGNVHSEISEDGTRVLSMFGAKEIVVWDARTGAEIQRLKMDTYGRGVDGFGLERELLLASLDRETAVVLNARTGEEVTRLAGHESRICSKDLSPDEKRAVTAEYDGIIRLFDPASGEELARTDTPGGGRASVLFTPDSARFLVYSSGNDVHIRDAADASLLSRLVGHNAWVRGVSFSPDGLRIITASIDKTARIWDAATGAELTKLIGHDGDVLSATFSPNGRRIVTTSEDKTARIWDAESGAEISRLGGHQAAVLSAAFSADGASILARYGDGMVRIWDAAMGPEVLRLNRLISAGLISSFSADDKRIMTASFNDCVEIWDAESRELISSFRGNWHGLQTATFSADGRCVVTGARDRVARIWEVETGRELTQLVGHKSVVFASSFTPDGQRVLTTSGDNTVRVWDAASGAELSCLDRRDDPFSHAIFGFGGRFVMTGSVEKHVSIVDLWTGSEIARLVHLEGPAHALAISADGGRAATVAASNSIQIWDIQTASRIFSMVGHGDRVTAGSFSADGLRLVTASADKTVRIWDTATGAELLRLEGHRDIVNSAEFNSDGTRVLTVSSDGTSRVWDVSSTCAAMYGVPAILEAALTRGFGQKTKADASDLLMRDAPMDLLESMRQLTPDTRAAAEAVERILRAPRAPQLYTSRSWPVENEEEIRAILAEAEAANQSQTKRFRDVLENRLILAALIVVGLCMGAALVLTRYGLILFDIE